jgi:hypothetical protein
MQIPISIILFFITLFVLINQHCIQIIINYPQLKVLNRPIMRLEMCMYEQHLEDGDTYFIQKYDDAHFHRSYYSNEFYILYSESQL